MTSTELPLHVEPDHTEAAARESQLPQKVAQHVAWFFGDPNLGLDGGDFVTRLLRLLAVADVGNRALLAMVFPDYVRAFVAVQNESWGLEWVRDVARGEGS